MKIILSQSQSPYNLSAALTGINTADADKQTILVEIEAGASGFDLTLPNINEYFPAQTNNVRITVNGAAARVSPAEDNTFSDGSGAVERVDISDGGSVSLVPTSRTNWFANQQ